MLLNLDTSDGHVMWWVGGREGHRSLPGTYPRGVRRRWGNPLWDNQLVRNDVRLGYHYRYDSKTTAALRLTSGTHVAIMVHTDGAYVGYQSWTRPAQARKGSRPGTALGVWSPW